MMTVHYKVFSPGGNITALLEEPVSGDRTAISVAIMAADPEIEQVGFIVPSNVPGDPLSLIMMGGEFCLNAIRAAALLHYQATGSPGLTIQTSGLSGIEASVSDGIVSVTLPASLIEGRKTIKEGLLVDLRGIRYVVTEDPRYAADPGKLIASYAGSNVPAIGVILLAEDQGVLTIEPWVQVAATHTLIKETACGSGSIAACFARMHSQVGEGSFQVRQPSGSTVSISFNTDSSGKIRFDGPVDYLGERNLAIV